MAADTEASGGSTVIRAVVPPRPLAPAQAPAEPAPLDIHEYLELEFAVGQEIRR